VLIGAVTTFVVFVESGQRRIAVNYAKRMVGRRDAGRPVQSPAVQAEHVGRDPADLRLVAAAVPGDARQLRGHRRGRGGRGRRFKTFMQNVSAALGYGQPLHMLLYGGC
jgi:preprotein translocase subunit SecY